jgi:hypothetical protein
MLAMEDLIHSVAIIATNPYKFVSLSGLISHHVGERERGIPNPSNALARKGPTMHCSPKQVAITPKEGIKTTGSSSTHHCNWHHRKVLFLLISGNLIHPNLIACCFCIALISLLILWA